MMWFNLLSLFSDIEYCCYFGFIFFKRKAIGYVFVSAISVISFEVLTGYVVFLFLREEGKIARSLLL